MRVEAGSANPTPPYDTAENAFAKVKDAAIYATNLVAQAESEDQFVEILVGAGRYAEYGIYVGRNVTLRGATGNRDDVVIGPSRDAFTMNVNTTTDKATYRALQATGPGATIADLTVTNGYVFGNSNYGGGAYLTSGATITNCHITRCVARYTPSSAAGMYINNSHAYDVLVDKCRRNPWKTSDGLGESYSGYAVYVVGTSIVDRCQIVDNSAGYLKGGGGSKLQLSGGALGVYNASGMPSTVRNCLIARNRIDGKTSSYAMGSGATIQGGIIENCTIVSNVSENVDGMAAQTYGLYVFNTQGSTTEYVRNCHIAENYHKTSLANFGAFKNNATYIRNVVTYCCTSSLTGGGGNFGPGCVLDDTTKWEFDEKGRFNLLAGSPCINKGLRLAWMTDDATDLYGNPRIYGKGLEIGAVEFITHGLTIIMK